MLTCLRFPLVAERLICGDDGTIINALLLILLLQLRVLFDSGNKIESTDFPTDLASPDAPPMPGAVAASTKIVAHTKAPSAEPIANHAAASLRRGENDIVVICRWFQVVEHFIKWFSVVCVLWKVEYVERKIEDVLIQLLNVFFEEEGRYRLDYRGNKVPFKKGNTKLELNVELNKKR